MVTFNLCLENETEITYEYYPDGNKEQEPGIITLDITQMKIIRIIPAKEDFLVRHPASEINELRNSVNRMRIEAGESELTEEDWPSAKEDAEYFEYACHAIDKIEKLYKANGVFPKEGTVCWY